ncbi:MAG: SCP-2 sterol transfer family protein [Proteobacteria bacterium]|nr:SCP-2 sterol transfer family protein [Pseudomonadota bacterium]
MAHPFLSDAWFTEVESLIAGFGDLQIPPAMKAAQLNITVTGSPLGDVEVSVVDGIFSRGHRAGAPTRVRLDAALARKIFVDADNVAGVQGFLAGEIHVDGDLPTLVAMQTSEPSEPQLALARRIASITA